MPMPAPERKLRASIAAHESWARTEDRAQRLAPARQAFADSFLDKVDPDHRLPPAERARRAENARKAHYQRLALKSAQARRRKRELNDQADRPELGGAA
ncbi:MAG: hypothetical protein ACR2JF_11855 [Iamia sp.]